MYRKALLGLLISSFLTCGLHAQSTSRGGSNSRYNGSSTTSMKAKERAMAKEISMVAKKIQRGQFAEITLDRTQRNTLEELVGQNMKQISSLNNQVGQMVPGDMVKKLQRFYNSSKRKGANEIEAMQMSMTKIGLEDATQEKILMLSAKTMEIEKMIAADLTDSLTEEQKATMTAAMKMKSESETAAAEGSDMEGSDMEGKMMEEKAMGDKVMADKGMEDKAMDDKVMDDKAMEEKSTTEEMEAKKMEMKESAVSQSR